MYRKRRTKQTKKKNSDLHFSVASVGTACRKSCRDREGVQIIERISTEGLNAVKSVKEASKEMSLNVF